MIPIPSIPISDTDAADTDPVKRRDTDEIPMALGAKRIFFRLYQSREARSETFLDYLREPPGAKVRTFIAYYLREPPGERPTTRYE